MLGARTVAAVIVALLAFAWAAARGVLDAAHLAALEPGAAFVAFLFAVLAMVVVMALLHPDGRSVFAVGFERGRPVAGAAARENRRVFDLPIVGQRLLYLVAFAFIGLGSFGNDAVSELDRAWLALRAPGAEYCRESPTVAAVAKPRAPAADQRGCALVRRAFELGYEKSLGSCAPKEIDAAEPAAGGPVAVAPCDGRAADEPLFHYTFRLLSRRGGEAREAASRLSIGESVARFSIKLDYLEPLLGIPTEAILGSPHAAHHIFTNVPAPRRSSWLSETFAAPRCSNAAENAPPSLDWSRSSEPASALLESAVAQLLLSRRYGPPPLACDELTIHWGASLDACDALAADPEATLERYGALESVEAAAARHRSLVAQNELGKRLGEPSAAGEPPPLARVISLSCLLVGGGESMRGKARIAGATLEVRALAIGSIEATGAAQLESYQAIATLLTGSPYAGAVEDSAASTARLRGEADGAILAGEGFALARLEVLADADPFLADGWALDRADLADVYPFESHLRRVAVSFRRRFGRLRGRL